MDVPVIELSGVVKSFGPVEVLKGVNLRAYAGKVTALVGDNGAGKSTLVKGLAGVQPYDSGEVRFAGEIVHLHTPREAAALGIEVVYQDLALCENLDIVQNMFLGREETSAGTLDEGVMERQASETLQSLSVRTCRYPAPVDLIPFVICCIRWSAAAAYRARSAAEPVRTCTSRPDSGSTTDSSPTSGRANSRGSTTCTATTWWRSATRRRDATQSDWSR